MSDTETTVDDVTTDVDTEIDTTDDSSEEISYEQALEWKKKAERLEKAEKTLVELKRKTKELEKSEPTTKYLTEADLERRDFLKANPELNEYTKELGEYHSKGLSFDEAKTLILNSDKARTNREKLNSLGLSDWEPNKWTKTYSDDDLVALSKKDINAYNKVMSDIESGKAKHK